VSLPSILQPGSPSPLGMQGRSRCCVSRLDRLDTLRSLISVIPASIFAMLAFATTWAPGSTASTG
jgi:hypothetical protein